MKILCVFGQHNYGSPERGEGYEYSNFLPALRRLGHEVVFFESFDRSCYVDFADLNLRLLETVQREAPDAILFVLMSYEIWLETLTTLRESSGAVLISWATDDSWKYEQFSRYVARPFDVYATTYPEALRKSQRNGHSNFVLTQWAADAQQLMEPLPAADCRYEVSFVGSAYGNRRELVQQLAQRGIAVDCFGHGWPNGPVDTARMRGIIRESVISLNFGDSGLLIQGARLGRNRQIKARNFEVPGCGGFLLTETLESLGDFFVPGREVVVYEGVDDLANKIRHYLDHPAERDAIAFAGHRRTASAHTYDARFRELLEDAARLTARRPSRAPRIDFARFSDHVRRHRANRWLMPLKWALLVPCWMIWGRQRGPRAARRFLFELSWRVAGAHTYTCAGYPGRLFYKES